MWCFVCEHFRESLQNRALPKFPLSWKAFLNASFPAKKQVDISHEKDTCNSLTGNHLLRLDNHLCGDLAQIYKYARYFPVVDSGN